jgi:GT2 family glycosyltransferase
MELSIIIVNYKTKGLLLDCLDAIYADQLMPLNFEVIVVDNASDDGSFEAVAERFTQVKLIVNEDNLGLAKAINKGLRVSRGKYILLLSPDIIFPAKTFPKMLEFMDKHPEAGALSPLLLDEEKKVRPLYGRLATFFSHLFRFLGIRGLIPEDLRKKARMQIDNFSDAITMDWLMSACLMLRHKAIMEVGRLDENLFFYFEDMELSYRLKDKGWKLYLIPKLPVVHIQHQSINLFSSGARQAIYRKSVLYFYYTRWLKSYLIKNR